MLKRFAARVTNEYGWEGYVYTVATSWPVAKFVTVCMIAYALPVLSGTVAMPSTNGDDTVYGLVSVESKVYCKVVLLLRDTADAWPGSNWVLKLTGLVLATYTAWSPGLPPFTTVISILGET